MARPDDEEPKSIAPEPVSAEAIALMDRLVAEGQRYMEACGILGLDGYSREQVESAVEEDRRFEAVMKSLGR